MASFDEPERRPHDDEVKDHVKQTWEKIKIDLTSDDDEAQEQDHEDVEMGDQREEAGDDEEEEEEEAFEMDDLNAEKRDFREKDEVDEYINKEREEVEKDEQEEEEIQGGEVNLHRFKAGEMQDAMEYPVVFGSRVLPTDPCMIGDAQPDLQDPIVANWSKSEQSHQTLPSEFLWED